MNRKRGQPFYAIIKISISIFYLTKLLHLLGGNFAKISLPVRTRNSARTSSIQFRRKTSSILTSVSNTFARNIPNFFVGLGLLGTFIGLIAALTFSTQNLTQAVDQEQIKEALKGLLITAAAKFYISAAGLVSFIILSFLFRLSLKYLHGIVHQINTSLEERISSLNLYAISERQVSLQQASLDELKLFNTNVAMRIGDAVRTALETSNSSLTTKLDQIAEAFGKLISASRDGAGSAVNEAMKGGFDASLRNTSDALASVANSLQDLPARLSVAAASIQNAGDAAAEQQRRLAESTQSALEHLRDATNQVASNIEQGTEILFPNLNTAGGTFSNSAASLGAFLERFSAGGEDYMKSLSSLTTQTTALEANFSTISSRITAASESLAKAGLAVEGNLAQVLNAIRDFTHAAEETNRSVNTSQEAISSTVRSLQQIMTTHIQRFDDVDREARWNIHLHWFTFGIASCADGGKPLAYGPGTCKRRKSI